jgi:hypothetical protein
VEDKATMRYYLQGEKNTHIVEDYRQRIVDIILYFPLAMFNLVSGFQPMVPGRQQFCNSGFYVF